MKIRMTKLCQIFLCALLSIPASAQTYDSLDIKIGQMIMIGMPSYRQDWRVMDDIVKNKVGALIFFEKNIPPNNSYVALKNIIWNYQKVAHIPLLICIDQEGGKVNRLKPKYGFPPTISNQAMGKSKTLDSAAFYGEITAATLAGLGFNVNFAPVVDLRVNPLNPIIAKLERAFSANPDTVSMMASAFIKAHHKMRLYTVLKHFPGHGSSSADTHLGLADVTNTWTERELIPYKKLIAQQKVDAIMTSHIVNRKIDGRGNPGTLSKKMIQDLLRDGLRYNGVVFSDDMQMRAITQYYGFEESIILSINAGVDILCFSNNITGNEVRTVDAVSAAIKNAVKKGDIPLKRINESYRRIMVLKRRLMPRADYKIIEEEQWPKPLTVAANKTPPPQPKSKRELRREAKIKKREMKRAAKAKKGNASNRRATYFELRS